MNKYYTASMLLEEIHMEMHATLEQLSTLPPNVATQQFIKSYNTIESAINILEFYYSERMSE